MYYNTVKHYTKFTSQNISCYSLDKCDFNSKKHITQVFYILLYPEHNEFLYKYIKHKDG